MALRIARNLEIPISGNLSWEIMIKWIQRLDHLQFWEHGDTIKLRTVTKAILPGNVDSWLHLKNQSSYTPRIPFLQSNLCLHSSSCSLRSPRSNTAYIFTLLVSCRLPYLSLQAIHLQPWNKNMHYELYGLLYYGNTWPGNPGPGWLWLSCLWVCFFICSVGLNKAVLMISCDSCDHLMRKGM